jgi:C-terminal processing protease CtpA/Prc
MINNINFKVLILFLFIGIQLSCAQKKDEKFSAQQDIRMLLSILKDNLAKQYFDKPKADSLVKKLTEMDTKKAFEGKSQEVAAQMITEMLRKETKDKHFNVIAYPIQPEQQQQQAPATNTTSTGGIASTKILKNNIGYIKWDLCMAGPEAFSKLRNALELVKDCKELIFDITDNPGGDGASSAFINQFLYKSKDYQTLLIKKCTGEADWHQSEVIFNYENGPKLFDMPLYILVNDKTFSAAEYFAFTAKEMKRATIIGKTTAGAGNPGSGMNFSSTGSETGFFMFIPNCQIITRAGHFLEGVGVQPDVQLKSSDWVNETIEYVMKQR